MPNAVPIPYRSWKRSWYRRRQVNAVPVLHRTTMSDLPEDLTKEILARVPLISLRAVRCTCKAWNAFSKSQILGESAARREQFRGFMIKGSRVCLLKFDLQRILNEKDFANPSVKLVRILDRVEISEVFYGDGLLLCVTKDKSRLLVWNPYLGQRRWIQPRNTFLSGDKYAIGYDKNHNYKILRIFGNRDNVIFYKYLVFGYEIYDLSSNSWKVYDVEPDFYIDYFQHGVFLKGHTYFLCRGKNIEYIYSFDFTTERFGKRLPLPFKSNGSDKFLSISCVRQEQLAVLHLHGSIGTGHTWEIWVTNEIDPNAVSWTKFLRFISGGNNKVDFVAGSFFIDEENKVAVIVDLAGIVTGCNQKAAIIGQDGYFKSVAVHLLGKALKLGKHEKYQYILSQHFRPRVCPSYVPSSVQLQQGK